MSPKLDKCMNIQIEIFLLGNYISVCVKTVRFPKFVGAIKTVIKYLGLHSLGRCPAFLVYVFGSVKKLGWLVGSLAKG